MFNITLYRFNKKTSSTATPAGGGDVFPCNIKSMSSLINPVIEIRSQDNTLLYYNYAYIEAFANRYYFVNNVVYDQGIFEFYLSADVLGTFKEDILNSSQYVARCTNPLYYDLNIADTAYPVIARKNVVNWGRSDYPGITDYPNGAAYKILQDGTTGTVNRYFNTSLEGGEFVLGIVGSNATGMEYYVFSYEGFKDLIEKVFTLTPSNMTSVDTGVANALYHPMDYIVSCRWFPEIPRACMGDLYNNLKIGNEEIFLFWGVRDLLIDKLPEFYTTFTLPKHPGDIPYQNLSPYTELNLYFPPFGSIPLDTTKVFNLNSVDVRWAIDYSVGLAHLKILGTDSNNSGILAELTSDYGVQIPISALVTDAKTALNATSLNFLAATPIGKAADAAAGLVNKGLNWVSKTWKRITGGEEIQIPAATNTDNKNVLESIADLISSAKGQVQSSGTIGSFLSFNEGAPYIYAYFYYQCDRDEVRFGVPTNKVIQLSNLTGFVICENAQVTYLLESPTESEASAIATALNNGVYIE